MKTLSKSLYVSAEIENVFVFFDFAFGDLGLSSKYPTDCAKHPLPRMEQLRCGSAMFFIGKLKNTR